MPSMQHTAPGCLPFPKEKEHLEAEKAKEKLIPLIKGALIEDGNDLQKGGILQVE